MKYAVLIIAALICTPAAAQKGYKAAKAASDVGYQSSVGTDGRVTIVYTGAKGAKPDDVAKYAMLRAAELTQDAGKEWFAVIKAETRDLAAGGGSDLRDKTGPSFSTGTGASASVKIVKGEQGTGNY